MSGCTLTISSGVHVGQRPEGDPGDFIDWFDAAPTTQFSQFSITAVPRRPGGATGGQGIRGHAGLRGEPIAFEFERLTRDVLRTNLAEINAEALLGGAPRATLSGFRDAAIRSGYLAEFTWRERNNATGALTDEFSVWGVCVVQDSTVRGLEEFMRVLVFPCDAAFWIGTRNWFLTPDAYASLGSGS